MRLIVSPSTGLVIDLDTVANHHPTTFIPGKYDPVSHAPLDDNAVKGLDLNHNNTGDNEAIRAAHLDTIAKITHLDVDAYIGPPASEAVTSDKD